MGVVRAQRRTTGLEAISKELAKALDSMTALKRLKGEQMIEEAALQAMQPQPNDTPETRMARITDAIKAAKSKATTKGPFGVPILDRALGMFNPNVPTFVGQAPIEKLISGEAVRNMFPTPYKEAQTESLTALAEQRKLSNERAARTQRLDTLKNMYKRYQDIANNLSEREGRRQYARDKLRDIEREMNTLTTMPVGQETTPAPNAIESPEEDFMAIAEKSSQWLNKPEMEDRTMRTNWTVDTAIDTTTGKVKPDVQVNDIMIHNDKKYKYLGNDKWETIQ